MSDAGGHLTRQQVYTNAWLWSFPPVYLVHLIDERYFWIGTADFASRYLGMPFTNTVWWWVNVPSMALIVAATLLVVRGTWPQWVAVAMAIHLALHGLGRVPTSLWTLEIAPGLISGLLLCTPLAAATLWRARAALPRSEIVRGVVAGVASFQPLWHFVLLPVLPAGPAGP